MSEIEIYENKKYAQFVSDRLAALHCATHSYGRDFNGPLISAWMLAMQAARVTEAEISAAVEHFLLNERDFPAPADLIKWVKNRRQWQAELEGRESRKAFAEEQSRALDMERDARLAANGLKGLPPKEIVARMSEGPRALMVAIVNNRIPDEEPVSV
jgi:hypothetical protein